MIKLDLVPSSIKPVLHASQYDDGRQWECQILNDGTPYVFQSGDTVDYTIRKGDGLLVTGAVAVTLGTSNITLVSTEQMCAVFGSNLGELTITSNGTKVGSVNFIIEVERAPDEGGITSQSEIKNLNRQITDEVDRILPDMVDEVAEPIINEKVPEKVAELVPIAVAEVATPVVNEIAPPIVSALVPEAVGDNYYNKTEVDGKISPIDYNKESGNIGAGQNALKNVSTGANNTAIGVSALQGVTTGGYNVGAGRSAGDSITTGSNNVVIGYNADVNAGSNAGVVAVGRNATSGDHSVAVGNGVSATGGYSTAMGDSAQATTNNSLALGRKAKANFVGAVAIGTDDQGTGAEASAQDEFVLGTPRHKYVFPGKLQNLVVASKTPNPTLGTEIAPAISGWSGSGATWNGSYWSLSEGDSISTPITVEADSDYLIVLTVSNAVTPNAEVKPMTISLDSDSISIFGANDATWQVVLHTTNSGAVTLSMGGATWSGRISNVSVKKVTSYINPDLTIESRNLHAYGTNVVFGNGHSKMALPLLGNTAVGYESQVALNSGKGNTAFGIKTQKSLTNGSHNTAVGENVQELLTTGMYNTAMGFHTQEHLISGCWNVSVGNENLKDTTTGCNNTTMGRRALNSLIDGHKNTVMGAQAGFVRDGVWDAIASIHSNEQAFYGFQATQYAAGQQDKACAFGSHACANENGLALGSYTQARGNGSVAIGMDSNGDSAVAENADDFVLGTSAHRFIFGDKVIKFNLDGTVTWEQLT